MFRLIPDNNDSNDNEDKGQQCGFKAISIRAAAVKLLHLGRNVVRTTLQENTNLYLGMFGREGQNVATSKLENVIDQI